MLDRNPARRFARVLLLAIAGVAVALVPWSTATAQGSPDDCAALSDPGDRIRCKTERLHGRVGDLVDEVTAPDLDFLTPEQKTQLRHARERADRERERTTADQFKRWSKKRDARCIVKEYDDPLGLDPDDDGNNDGICDRNELCEEDNFDQIGDNDSKCEKFKEGRGKPIWEPCVEICDPDAMDADEGNFDVEAADEIERELDDTAAIVEETAGMVEDLRRSRAARTSDSGAAVAAADDPCAQVRVGERDFDFDAMEGLLVGSNASKLGADTCRAGCGQEAFGWNCRAVCLVFGIAENVLKAVSNAAELQDDAITGERLDAAARCIEALDAQVKETGDKLEAVRETLDAFVTMVRERLDEANRLLRTPQGRRDDFPAM